MIAGGIVRKPLVRGVGAFNCASPCGDRRSAQDKCGACPKSVETDCRGVYPMVGEIRKCILT